MKKAQDELIEEMALQLSPNCLCWRRSDTLPSSGKSSQALGIFSTTTLLHCWIPSQGWDPSWVTFQVWIPCPVMDVGSEAVAGWALIQGGAVNGAVLGWEEPAVTGGLPHVERGYIPGRRAQLSASHWIPSPPRNYCLSQPSLPSMNCFYSSPCISSR